MRPCERAFLLSELIAGLPYTRGMAGGVEPSHSRASSTTNESPFDSPFIRLRLLNGELSVVADEWVVGIQADKLVEIFDRPSVLAELHVGNAPLVVGLVVVRLKLD